MEEKFGDTGRCSQWIASYLTGRSFSIRVRASTSSSIPQGLVLGPMLYVWYLTPVGDQCHEYADDTQLFTKMPVLLTVATGTLLEGLQYWFWNNGPLLNLSKSAIIYFGTHGQLKNCTLPMVAKQCQMTHSYNGKSNNTAATSDV